MQTNDNPTKAGIHFPINQTFYCDNSPAVDLLSTQLDPEDTKEWLMDTLATQIVFFEKKHFSDAFRLGQENSSALKCIDDLQQSRIKLYQLLQDIMNDSDQTPIRARITVSFD